MLKCCEVGSIITFEPDSVTDSWYYRCDVND
jgi:hypothetical protein